MTDVEPWNHRCTADFHPFFEEVLPKASVLTQKVADSIKDNLPFPVAFVTGGCQVDEKGKQICDNTYYFSVDPITPPKCSKEIVTKKCLFEPRNTEYLNRAINALNEEPEKFNQTITEIEHDLSKQRYEDSYYVRFLLKSMYRTGSCQEAYDKVHTIKPDNLGKYYDQLLKMKIHKPDEYNSPEECKKHNKKESEDQYDVLVKDINANYDLYEHYTKLIRELYRDVKKQ